MKAEDEEVQEEVRSNKNGVPSSEGKCEETNPSARLRVCLPRLEAGGSQLYLTGQETFSETFCYNRSGLRSGQELKHLTSQVAATM